MVPSVLLSNGSLLLTISDEVKKHAAKDSEGDIVVADADGQPANEIDKAESTGDQTGPDAVDTTMQ